ncbi:MAG: hypothetical protein U1F17_09365 [Burkholderiaceae bacterium]
MRAAAVLVAAAGWAKPALAQLPRSFPPAARLGRLEIRVFPEATLNGEPMRLAAGARIYDQRNMIVMPASLSGSFDALVERDPVGNVGRVWILTPDELAAAQARERERPSGSAGQGR